MNLLARGKIVLDDFWLVTNQKLGFAEGPSVSHSGVTMQKLTVERAAEVLLAISREFGKSMEWLLTGED